MLLWVVVRPGLPESFQSPGSALLQGLAAAGAALLLVPMGFAWAKRTARAQSAARWFSAHALAAVAGTVMVLIHTAGRLDEPPALLLLLLAALMALGIWARISGAERMANTFGTKGAAFSAPDARVRTELADLLEAKVALLRKLDPDACEAQFSPRPRHWLRTPRLTWRFVALARRESRLIGQRHSVGSAQAWWRPVHLVLAFLFTAGLLVHVILVTFFAGWVAGERPVTWWHLAAW